MRCKNDSFYTSGVKQINTMALSTHVYTSVMLYIEFFFF